MSEFKFKKLILLVLILYCGQTLALPLLSCCDFMSQIPENQMLDHHNHSAMAMNSDEHQMMSGSDEANSKFHCDYCGIASIALTDIISPNRPVLAEHNSFYSFLLHSNPTDSPFKPPISA